MKLYTYFRSSAAYRVRIALSLKGLPYEAVPVHLVRSGGEQLTDEYRAINPSALVPTLREASPQDGADEGAKGATITQSMAIVEYLEETHPAPPLLPASALGRARVRALAQMIACDIHPLNNLRVLRYLAHTLMVSDEARNAWYRHWIGEGFAALEAHLTHDPAHDPKSGRFCHGNAPTIADCFLVPQVYNAARFGVDMTPYPRIAAIDAACAELPAFAAAHPSRQPDAE